MLWCEGFAMKTITSSNAHRATSRPRERGNDAPDSPSPDGLARASCRRASRSTRRNARSLASHQVGAWLVSLGLFLLASACVGESNENEPTQDTQTQDDATPQTQDDATPQSPEDGTSQAQEDGTSQAQDDDAPPIEAPQAEPRLPQPASDVIADCLFPDDGTVVPLQVDFPEWLAVADDIIVGTIASMTPVWTPLFERQGSTVTFLETDDRCVHAHPAIDLELSDVRSLSSGETIGTRTVRLSGMTLAWWRNFGNIPDLEIGSTEIDTWRRDTNEYPPTLAVGMSIGGAVYPYTGDGPGLMFDGLRDPLLEIVEGDIVQFQDFEPLYHCPHTAPSVEDAVASVDGMTFSEAHAFVVATDLTNIDHSVVDAFRAHLDHHGEERPSEIYYASLCWLPVGRGDPVPFEPTEECPGHCDGPPEPGEMQCVCTCHDECGDGYMCTPDGHCEPRPE